MKRLKTIQHEDSDKSQPKGVSKTCLIVLLYKGYNFYLSIFSKAFPQVTCSLWEFNYR